MKRALLPLLLLAACGGEATADADNIAAELEAEVSTITKAVEITEDNDPNNLLGRPGGYVEAVVLHDSRVTCDDALSVDCGAKVEVFEDADAAEERSAYIQGILNDAPALGTEYHYLDGASLVRVTGQLKPSLAADYEAVVVD